MLIALHLTPPELRLAAREFQGSGPRSGPAGGEGEAVGVTLEKDEPRRWTSAEKWQVWLAGAGLLVAIATGVMQFAR
ncbi:hypothetical protein GCM10009574_003340 [Streptomyces asiaticus]